MGWFGSSAYEKHLSEKIQTLEHELKMNKAYIKSLEECLRPCEKYHSVQSYSRVHFSNSDEICRLRDLLKETLDERDHFRNMCDERRAKIRDLEHKISEIGKPSEENRLRRTLEQYSKDAREDKAEIQRLKYLNQKHMDKIVSLLEDKPKLEKELKMYKEFFTGNEVNVFVKDKEVEMDEASLNKAQVDKLNAQNGFIRVD